MKLEYFIVPLVVTLLTVFPVRWIAIKLGIYAKSNERTIHTGNIPRIGGVAIYIGFLVGMYLYGGKSDFVRALIYGASIVFVEGLIDDIFDVRPWVKIVCQLAAAICLIKVGHVSLNVIHLPFSIYIHSRWIIYLVIVCWVVGITNAINLIDGLDGLAAGFSIIVIMTISIICTRYFHFAIASISLVLAGSAMGFLFHNFHPASIFMGDCGSQLLGFLIAAISLESFKSATFITLLLPIIMLFIPIMDTFSAILRRKLIGKSFASADKSHFHHQLMNGLGLGQTGAVLVIYVMTILFGINAFVYATDREPGQVMLISLVIIFEIFIEYTGMISPKFRPILNLVDRLTRRNKE